MAVDALTNYLANESTKFVFKRNFPKTKILAVTMKFGPLQEAVVNNNIKVVENFIFLGCASVWQDCHNSRIEQSKFYF